MGLFASGPLLTMHLFSVPRLPSKLQTSAPACRADESPAAAPHPLELPASGLPVPVEILMRRRPAISSLERSCAHFPCRATPTSYRRLSLPGETLRLRLPAASLAAACRHPRRAPFQRYPAETLQTAGAPLPPPPLFTDIALVLDDGFLFTV